MRSHQEWVGMTLDLLEKTPLREAYLIGLWNNALNGPVLKQIERQFGLGRDEFNVLYTLLARGPSLASDICQLNSRPKNSISRAVTKLVERGALTKTLIEEDRRKETLSLTDLGRELCNNATVLFVERQRELMQPLDYEERRMFEALLKKALMDGPDWRRNL